MNRLSDSIKSLNNKKGFTLMEAMFATAFGTMIVMAAIVAPVTLLRQAKDYSQSLSFRNSIQIVTLALRQDIRNAKENIEYEGDLLIVGDKIYSFTQDGTYRDNQKLTDMVFEATFFNNAISISTRDKSDNGYMTLSFNHDTSSFHEGDSYEQ